jgi:hypothetical protein
MERNEEIPPGQCPVFQRSISYDLCRAESRIDACRAGIGRDETNLKSGILRLYEFAFDKSGSHIGNTEIINLEL